MNDLKQQISFAVKEGYLDEDIAREMTEEEMEEYLGWADSDPGRGEG